MKILKELGSTTLDGRYSKPRTCVEAQCEICGTISTLRKDQALVNKSCKACVGTILTIKAKEIAAEKLQLNSQVCTKCNTNKPLSEFHKDSSKESGYRAVCKGCRNVLEKDSTQAYRKSEAGKISNANKKGKRMSRIKSTCDNTITSQALNQLKIDQNHQCYYCKSSLDFSIVRGVHLDHVIPLSKGGAHSITNVVWSCAKCNLSKGAKLS